jgi:hypothetical protein
MERWKTPHRHKNPLNFPHSALLNLINNTPLSPENVSSFQGTGRKFGRRLRRILWEPETKAAARPKNQEGCQKKAVISSSGVIPPPE